MEQHLVFHIFTMVAVCQTCKVQTKSLTRNSEVKIGECFSNTMLDHIMSGELSPTCRPCCSERITHVYKTKGKEHLAMGTLHL